MHSLHIQTRQREEMVLISASLETLIRDNGWKTGALLVYSPHTTAGLTINEAADPDVARDMTSFFSRLVPPSPAFRHAEGNSDAHIKTSMVGPHCLVPVENGRLLLGTWQGVYLCEWDGPRKRTVWVGFLPGI